MAGPDAGGMGEGTAQPCFQRLTRHQQPAGQEGDLRRGGCGGCPRLEETGMQLTGWTMQKGGGALLLDTGSARPAGPERPGHRERSKESEDLGWLWVKAPLETKSTQAPGQS